MRRDMKNNKTKTVWSAERSTGRGATTYEAILVDGEWVRVSDYPGRTYLGRDHGWEDYEAIVPASAHTAHFYRSNSGKEQVTIEEGPSFRSFEAARKWGHQIAGRARRQHKCPTCGREM